MITGMDDATTSPTSANQVLLAGRLAADPVLRSLPSGDELLSFRLTVPRPDGGRVRVDSIDCASTRVRVRRTVQRASPGDVLHVTGALRRRFWRTAAGLGSRYEVEVITARRQSAG
jgi:single-strand DNA-binding protein